MPVTRADPRELATNELPVCALCWHKPPEYLGVFYRHKGKLLCNPCVELHTSNGVTDWAGLLKHVGELDQKLPPT